MSMATLSSPVSSNRGRGGKRGKKGCVLVILILLALGLGNLHPEVRQALIAIVSE